jgi:hypothetical protein
VEVACEGCHEHDEADVRSEHLDEGISNFENCLEVIQGDRSMRAIMTMIVLTTMTTSYWTY